MDVNINNLADDCINAINDKVKNLTTLNIIVAGKTGVGKSTLINSTFRENLAETGMGKPVTTHMRKLTKQNVPLAIYDTKGFELGKNAQADVKDEILQTIKDGIKSKDINDAIHCIWYCISTTSNRVEPEEIKWLKELSSENQTTQVPIIIVLTQSFSKKNSQELKNYLLNENLDVVQIVPILAQDYEIDDDYIAKSYGLESLIHVMSQVLPDELQYTFQNVQRVCLAEKKKLATAAVAAATTAAFSEGFAPIPFADAALLIPTQITMIASITAIFGIEVNKSILVSFVSSAFGAGGATIAGKTIVSNLLKLIPGAGTIAGGAISGATAGLLTSALGGAYILLMEAIYKGELAEADLATDVGKKKLKSLFKQQLKLQKDTQ